MQQHLKVLRVDARTAFYKVERYPIGDFFGPVDLGLHLSIRHDSLNFGTGLLAGSIFPGSNRMIFTGFSPAWDGFYISSMGGAGLVFDNLGLNLVSVSGAAPTPSILVLNRIHGEEIEVAFEPVNPALVWGDGRKGIYAMIDHVWERCRPRFTTDPRILATGPASLASDIGAICSVPVEKGKPGLVDTWAGRGGFGSKLAQQHNVFAVIYGGTHVDEDFRDRKVADQWFEDRYQKKMMAKDLEATAKYRFDAKFETGGTFGVNFATLKGKMLSFNYSSIHATEAERVALHGDLVVNHYLKQFNQETIAPKQQKTCGEPCAAVCKKMNGEFKKDYEPYQTMGPQSGIFDQRAAERLNHHADMLGYDAISIGGVLSWAMECLHRDLLTPAELGVDRKPVFTPQGFDVVAHSHHNAELGVQLLDRITARAGLLDLADGARKAIRRIARQKGQAVMDAFVCTAFGRNGWMVPNQYWTPGALSPMPIMGKYYMHYGDDWKPPRELGRANAARLKGELTLDNLGICRFHRAWAEDLMPEVIGHLYGLKDRFLANITITAARLASRNASVFWESARCAELVHTFLKRKRDVDQVTDPSLLEWIARFDADRGAAALDFWYEIHKGIAESLREFE